MPPGGPCQKECPGVAGNPEKRRKKGGPVVGMCPRNKGGKEKGVPSTDAAGEGDGGSRARIYAPGKPDLLEIGKKKVNFVKPTKSETSRKTARWVGSKQSWDVSGKPRRGKDNPP